MADLPLFYAPHVKSATGSLELDDETRRHVCTVLRMKPGDKLLLTDGKGYSVEASIAIADKKKLVVLPGPALLYDTPERKLIIAVSLLKNAARFEWMLEKLTEIGVTEIIPIICERTERQHFRFERANQIVISASMQSKQFHFPLLHAPIKFNELFSLVLPDSRFIAHCMEGEKKVLVAQQKDAILLIGPEGDFTDEEVQLAIHSGFTAVGLGVSRLRTETAGIVGAVMMR